MSIAGYDNYWDNYQLKHDPQMQDYDEDQEKEDEEAYLDWCDHCVDEKLLERN